MKLTGNAFLVCLTGGLKDTLSLAKALGITADDVTTLFTAWNPGTGVTARIKRMTSGDHSSASWELSMARKDTGLFLQAAKDSGVTLTLLPAIAALMDQWIEKGYGNYDWTVIAKD
jgi:3-hydroxyisobutyrate dehydrogenase